MPAELWNFPDRAHTVTGGTINAYLTGGKELDDKAIHLLFSANRYEKRCAGAGAGVVSAHAWCWCCWCWLPP